ncbi:hypothetical protein [Photobacterium leiognathi]|uniref:hypothetical protein n=1 Tax=Photobacterium leiognathi TaxID=553611 RepID=UPI002981F017|nr:hypothetical protein [Photobacterium leiognathi]
MSNSVLFVDICDTLYPENTTVGFINYVMTLNNKKNPKYINNKFFKIINSIIYKIFDIDIYRKILISNLKGFSDSELCSYAESYIRTLKPNKTIVEMVDNYIKLGFVLEFHSASIDPVVSVVSELFNAKYSSSSLLSYENNICQGILRLDRLGKKEEEILKSSKKYNKSIFITDNKSDYVCHKYCDKFIAVIPKNKSSLFWDKKDVEIVRL